MFSVQLEFIIAMPNFETRSHASHIFIHVFVDFVEFDWYMANMIFINISFIYRGPGHGVGNSRKQIFVRHTYFKVFNLWAQIAAGWTIAS
jgi:hypothetical protein